MTGKLYEFKLTADEAMLLDGKVSAEAQDVVNRAIEDERVLSCLTGASPAIRAFVADVVREANENGRLVFDGRSLSHGKYSGKSLGYATHRRSSRYHRKGEADYKRPITFAGFELANRCVIIQGRATIGDSLEFLEEARPFLAVALRDVRAEIPEQVTGEPPRWKYQRNAKCQKCGWEGHEGEMGRSPCLMGPGTYPSTCPGCGVRNELFRSTVDIGGKLGFVVVPVERRAA